MIRVWENVLFIGNPKTSGRLRQLLLELWRRRWSQLPSTQLSTHCYAAPVMRGWLALPRDHLLAFLSKDWLEVWNTELSKVLSHGWVTQVNLHWVFQVNHHVLNCHPHCAHMDPVSPNKPATTCSFLVQGLMIQICCPPISPWQNHSRRHPHVRRQLWIRRKEYKTYSMMKGITWETTFKVNFS